MTPDFWNNHTVRDLERASIRAFVEAQRGYLRGRVLDWGAGKPGTCRQPQPYRDLVEGEYVPYDLGDRADWPAYSFDAVLCTQVLQYVDDPWEVLDLLWHDLKDGGHLVLTYPTSWDEVETNDLWRFTKAGMELLLKDARFKVLVHERRAEIDLNGFKFPLGYGVVATK